LNQARLLFSAGQKTGSGLREKNQGIFLNVVEILPDCDNDTLLIKANPVGPTCHTGTDTCWSEVNQGNVQFLSNLQDLISKRKEEMPEGSYTTSLFKGGVHKISQKVGEEAVETIIGALTNNDENFIYESADLLYHLMVLLSSKGYRIEDVVDELQKRHK
jgi:phosphoribosyl-ATP pyrophosphohydrolase/phosphoribosyl-AMP cyclohydrolase